MAPTLPSLPQYWNRAKGKDFKGKGGGKGFPKGKTLPLGPGADSSGPKLVWDLLKNNQRLRICAKYNSRSGCDFKQCKFAHICAVARQDGTACGGKHSAAEHRATPH